GALPIYVRQPYVDQVVASMERAIGSRWKLEGVYVYRTNHDAVALIDRNEARDYTAFSGVRVTDHFNRPLLAPNGQPLVIDKLYIRNDDILRVLRLPRSDMLNVPGFTQDDTLRVFYSPAYELANAPQLRREFRQVQLNLNAAYPGWSGVFSLAWTNLYGNQASVTG